MARYSWSSFLFQTALKELFLAYLYGKEVCTFLFK